jgi:single-strand DNA-binding protein
MSAPITLSGNLVADPEMTFSKNGMAVCKFRVATNERKYDKTSNEWKDGPTSYWHVTAFRKLAENVAESLTKGNTVIVVGKVAIEQYETAQGEKRNKTEIIADKVGAELTRVVATLKRPGEGAQGLQSDPWAAATDQSSDIPF